jgi:hypothetical protein
LQKNDVEVQFSNGVPVSLTLVLRHFKNIRNNFPVTISLEANKQDTLLCPVLALQHYLEVNKTGQGPLFQFPGGSPVTHAFVSKNLSKILDFIGLDTRFLIFLKCRCTSVKLTGTPLLNCTSTSFFCKTFGISYSLRISISPSLRKALKAKRKTAFSKTL